LILEVNLNIEKLHNFGICITNIDYNSKEQAQQVGNYVAKEKIVCIKNSEAVDPGVLVKFYKNIGRVAAQNEKVTGSGVGGYGELVQVKSDGLFQGKDDGELVWHNAIMQKSDAENVVGMYMHHLAESGGDTYFSNSQLAYEDLDQTLKEKLDITESKTIYYPLKDDILSDLAQKSHIKEIFPDFDTFKEWKDIDGNLVYTKQVKSKPLVTEHPVTKSKGLYFPFLNLRGFVGMPKAESNELFDFLKNHILKEKYVYRHKWSKYDICLSDQIHSLHKRDAYTGFRELWRAGIWT